MDDELLKQPLDSSGASPITGYQSRECQRPLAIPLVLRFWGASADEGLDFRTHTLSGPGSASQTRPPGADRCERRTPSPAVRFLDPRIARRLEHRKLPKKYRDRHRTAQPPRHR